jgi:hypothetical protein
MNESLSNPIVIMALMLVGSMILLIGAAVLGIDKGVLRNMSNMEYARGLITYLFAVMTIGTAVVLVLSALLPVSPPNTEATAQDHFNHGKEILSLMLGVFGTIVGYYFGATAGGSAPAPLRLAPLRVTPKVAGIGESITVTTVATGGVAPYRAGIGLGSEQVEPKDPVGDDGWIVKEVRARQFQAGEPTIMRVVLQDSMGKRTETTTPMTLRLSSA